MQLQQLHALVPGFPGLPLTALPTVFSPFEFRPLKEYSDPLKGLYLVCPKLLISLILFALTAIELRTSVKEIIIARIFCFTIRNHHPLFFQMKIHS